MVSISKMWGVWNGTALSETLDANRVRISSEGAILRLFIQGGRLRVRVDGAFRGS